ncbi:hypothetical protein ACTI_72980 [Actinoplanes sp. OR16]|uniref:class I SAM-dependent methyltransferase n=1 Tax=Actinoplanes sp. OR16 TaxID=946334 RepID=UPI000F6BEF5B|nr:class I SAM-dependent methyltransferase [Actinoplanes sp. OR16]BBH70613.1 hypothetical protein ACTI_72980 [Actinoplanes sp. OR16]
MSQRAIYDRRYAGTGYDQRSAVPVLTAERNVLRRAADRVLTWLPESEPITLLDFACGTGRVTNEFAGTFHSHRGGLRLVAYDVSAVGLEKAAHSLIKDFGFDVAETLRFDHAAGSGYPAGSMRRISDGITVEVLFVHGSEADDAETAGKILREANLGRAFAVTTSWYSGLAHIPTADRRGSFFTMLNDVTDPRGELLVASSVSGDLVDLQAEWEDRRRRGDIGGWPIEMQGDVVYQTELMQENFCHVFGADLAALLEANREPSQSAWLEAVRMPDPEFSSEREERDNFRRVVAFNETVRHRSWRPEDYREVHTAVAIRSGLPRTAHD